MSFDDPLSLRGQVLADKYEIEWAVGAGGFSTVYRARHTIWNKPVAVKFFTFLSAATGDKREALQASFVKEGALLTDLSSSTAHIVQAWDVGTFTTADGRWLPYIVLEWLDGASLQDLLDSPGASSRAPWSVGEIVHLLGPIADALELAHQRGVAHRDVKPGNIFVVGGDPRQPTSVIKLLDFGVAKRSDGPLQRPSLAKTGVAGSSFTPQYGAPEQFSRSFGATGPWTDVFALALVSVELLTGADALDGGDVTQLAYCASRPDRRPTPRTYGVQVSDSVEAVFVKALQPRPADRYSSAGEFWAALRAAAADAATRSQIDRRASADRTGGTASRAALALTRDAPPIARRRLARMMGVGVAAVLPGVGFAWWAGHNPADATRSRPPTQPRPVALAHASRSASIRRVSACPSTMASIPGGQFFMGSDQRDAGVNERPVHHVVLSAFCLDDDEVTVADYEACSRVGRCRRSLREAEWPGISEVQRRVYSEACNAGSAERERHPINCVTWEMADQYCRAQSKRLPTEAEWEYAARGSDGRYYPWGDAAPTPSHLNACGRECVLWARAHGVALAPLYDGGDGFATTAPVGSYPEGSSRFGPRDMVGNVWEWVADWYEDYSTGEQRDPQGPAQGEKRVIRGGGWDGSDATWLRPSFRFGQVPVAKSPTIGFRCALSIR